jgi:hypothetical protein
MLDVAQLAEADSPADASQKIDPNKPASRGAVRRLGRVRGGLGEEPFYLSPLAGFRIHPLAA